MKGICFSVSDVTTQFLGMFAIFCKHNFVILFAVCLLLFSIDQSFIFVDSQ